MDVGLLVAKQHKGEEKAVLVLYQKKKNKLLYKKNDMFKGPTQKPMRLAHDGP
jgi:hypothetical protein